MRLLENCALMHPGKQSVAKKVCQDAKIVAMLFTRNYARNYYTTLRQNQCGKIDAGFAWTQISPRIYF